MRPQLHKLPLSIDSSFLFLNYQCSYFDKPWHFHKEFELVLIDDNTGTRFIGDQVSLYKDGDLVLIGPNIPHFYKSDEEYYKRKDLMAKSTFLHFTDDFLGKYFFDLPEMKLVRKLLDSASLGIEILGKANSNVKKLLLELTHQGTAQRLVGLLNILILLSTTKELKPILSRQFTATSNKDSDKIDKAFQFILNNYHNDIYIENIARQLNMSTASFSRYFKHHTRKTFSNYVTEIRISHACRLLMEDNYSISEICYLSGFENRSNFYRHFSKYTGMIPKTYQSRFFSNTKQ